MPTPVSTARQCLTSEAAHALDEAVSVARRRGHAQTTSLHAISALLSLPNSALREACARARNAAYSPRLQFKALELCLSVSLDRVSSTQQSDDPPVSNSLMAAIKRSQANQRRQPENYHLYHQLQQQQPSMSCVKVELQHLILSILDDPVVSRVFGEAGFRSSELRLAVLRPFPHLLRYSRSQGHPPPPPPLFLCNPDPGPGPGRRRPVFPFSGFPNGDENCRRIGEVLGRNRNPLLVGVCAYDALHIFVGSLTKDGILPVELSGLSSISIEKELSKFTTIHCDRGCLNSRLREVGELAEQCLGPGIVLNIGDLNMFVAEDSLGDSVTYVVAQLTRLVELHRGRLWLIGATASYGTYLKLVGMFPTVEKDWGLQLLPITSLGAESYPRSSLMESFVPFGGFFSAPSDPKLPLSCSNRCLPRNHQCNAVPKGGFSASVAGQHQASLPSWMQMAPLGPNKGSDMKTKDNGVLSSSKVTVLQGKGDDNTHESRPPPLANLFPTIVGFESAEDKKHNHSNKTNISSNENSCIPVDVQEISTSQSSVPPKAKSESFSSGVWEKPTKDEDIESGSVKSSYSLSNSSIVEGSRTSPTSSASVTTDLGLGICSSPASKLNLNLDEGRQHDISGFSSSDVDLFNGNSSIYTAQSSFCSSPDKHGQFDPSDVKMLFRALFERVGWQTEAISAISQRIARCHSRSEHRTGARHRRGMWFNFVGPDRYGKKKIASVVAEVLYGSQKQLICVDLNSQDGMVHSDTMFGCQVLNGYDAKCRGKTVVDYVAGELCKKPLSVVLLENVDKADVVAQNSLSQAVLTGKFSDSHGRQVSTSNAMFITTTEKDCSILTSKKAPSNYSEERISQAKGWPLQITVECALEGITVSQNWRTSSNTTKESIPHFLNKRKLSGTDEPLELVSETSKRPNKTSTRYLDLNLPAEENAVQRLDDETSENDCFSENSNSWLQEFTNQVDETVVFKPVDFDARAEKMSKEIKNSFHKLVGSDCLLEIDTQVVEQLLAAAYLSDKYRVVEDWVEQVLSRGFAEVQKRHNLNARTTVKLKPCEGICLEEESSPENYLLPKIILK
ncbi:putative ATP-dependent Clp protease ATP-binding subunit ClpA [Rosa chinensis]|uniref:Putative ATP-dependent Clp protease ATP-binding subunit ClpA n=1 Tax=Rosa chinensis TaxID=74649 RepID=A0A2P6SLA4_ROSCH|nr:protein SMAX1-LIKE 7 isoform X1 [Rosa chinensis]PRQ59453.1 putative ATP-dependent Clp protease ATP-binding subunit ClpA [Rosa chinensis]